MAINFVTIKNDIQRWSCCKNDHHHIEYSAQLFNRQQLSNNLKRKAVEARYDKPSKLIRGALSKDIPTVTTYDLTIIRNNIHLLIFNLYIFLFIYFK